MSMVDPSIDYLTEKVDSKYNSGHAGCQTRTRTDCARAEPPERK